MSLTLIEVHSIAHTEETGLYLANVTAELIDGIPEVMDSYIRASDPHGLSPMVIEWMAENPDFPVSPYVPPPEPTPEELRSRMPALTARQFRLGLVAGGFNPTQVSQAIEAMPEGANKETAKIEWEYATTFNRTHPLIATVGAALGLNDAQIDAMWLTAVNL